MTVVYVLKQQWERYKEHITLSRNEIETVIAPTIPDQIVTIELLAEGCANSNFKISFLKHKPVVLRVYTREASSLTREYDLFRLLEHKIPIAQFLSIDASQKSIEYPYAISSYVDGKSMRDVVLDGNEKAIRQCCLDAGRQLAILSGIKFEHSGFFEQGLNVRRFKPEEEYFNYCMALLTETSLQKDLGKELVSQVKTLIKDNHEKCVPSGNKANLTHGDFDPANIKVAETNGTWKVAGILDWEFAFAGSYFLDIGMMLRFSHKLPTYYETSFIEGFSQNGGNLPKTWKRSAKLMDFICLLQLVYFNPRENRPKLNLDVTGLIKHTVDNWKHLRE